MAWTAPRTWVTAEIVTSGLLNTHVRDNMLQTAVAKATTADDLLYASGANALARLGIGANARLLTVVSGLPAWGQAFTYKRVASDLSFDSVADSITDFDFAVAANEKWHFEIELWIEVNADNSGSLELDDVPTGATGSYARTMYEGGVSFDIRGSTGAIAAGTTTIPLWPSGTLAVPLTIRVVVHIEILVGANAGTLTWDAVTSGGAASTLKASSWLLGSGLSA